MEKRKRKLIKYLLISLLFIGGFLIVNHRINNNSCIDTFKNKIYYNNKKIPKNLDAFHYKEFCYIYSSNWENFGYLFFKDSINYNSIEIKNLKANYQIKEIRHFLIGNKFFNSNKHIIRYITIKNDTIIVDYCLNNNCINLRDTFFILNNK